MFHVTRSHSTYFKFSKHFNYSLSIIIIFKKLSIIELNKNYRIHQISLFYFIPNKFNNSIMLSIYRNNDLSFLKNNKV